VPKSTTTTPKSTTTSTPKSTTTTVPKLCLLGICL
jgi:hypothetical protein